jgi:excisionase family DNA binding protein
LPSPKPKLFEVYKNLNRDSMLKDMNDVQEQKPFNILNALSSYQRLITVEELAELLGRSKFTIYRMARTKQIPSLPVGGSRKFDPSRIAMWLTKKDPQLAIAARWQLNKAA